MALGSFDTFRERTRARVGVFLLRQEAEAENPGDVISWAVDDEGVVRACTAFGGDDAHTTIRVRDDVKSPWRDLLTIPFQTRTASSCVAGRARRETMCLATRSASRPAPPISIDAKEWRNGRPAK